MTRISFILVLCCLLVWAPVAAQDVKKIRPNIVLIVADDHGREAVGCYGNKAVKTLNIDRLATEGTRFTNAFCTVASCSPSRAVLLTGMQSHTNGMYGLEHQQHHFSSFDSVRSLPVLLQAAGYRTARIGKFHVAPESVYHFEKVLQETGVNNPASLARNPVVMADLCKSFISDTSAQPFFLYFATDDPHRSNSLLPDGTPFFDGSKPNPFGNKREGYLQVEKFIFKPEDVEVPSFLPDTRAVREELAAYYEAISRLDQGVGRLLEHIKASGKYDNTIIIYLSDNGSPFPGSKTNLYEPGIKLPCIVKLPKPTKPNFVQSAMISWVDIAPTLLDFANSPRGTEQMQGRSMRPIIEQENVSGWDEIYASHSFHEIMMYYPMRVLRERKYKLIWNIAWKLPFPQSLDLHQSYTWQNQLRNKDRNAGRLSVKRYLYRPQFELYDLQHDPGELHNLAADPKFSKELERMKEKLKQFQQKTRDMWLSKWEFE